MFSSFTTQHNYSSTIRPITTLDSPFAPLGGLERKKRTNPLNDFKPTVSQTTQEKISGLFIGSGLEGHRMLWTVVVGDVGGCRRDLITHPPSHIYSPTTSPTVPKILKITQKPRPQTQGRRIQTTSSTRLSTDDCRVVELVMMGVMWVDGVFVGGVGRNNPQPNNTPLTPPTITITNRP